MNNRYFKIITTTLTLFLCLTPVCFAEGIDLSEINSQKFGIMTLLPPIVAIILAFITKNVVVSLFVGIISGSFLINLSGGNIFTTFVSAFLDVVNRALESLSDPWNAGIILQVLAIGGVIHLVAKMGGAKAIAEALSKRAKTSKGAQLIAWFAGLLVFFDDYANSLIIGPMMRPVTDKMKISREKLAFIIDATAAPIAGLAIISTWIGLEVGLINDAFTGIGVNVDAFGVFLDTIPFRFYNILILAFILITTLFMKDFGPMRKAELRTKKENNTSIEVLVDEKHSDLEPLEGVKLSVWNAIIPIGTLIISALVAFYYSGYSSIMGGEDLVLIKLFEN